MCAQLAVIKVSLIKECVYVYISVCLTHCDGASLSTPLCAGSYNFFYPISFQPTTTCSTLHAVNPLFPVYLSVSLTGAPFIGNYGVVAVYLATALFTCEVLGHLKRLNRTHVYV